MFVYFTEGFTTTTTSEAPKNTMTSNNNSSGGSSSTESNEVMTTLSQLDENEEETTIKNDECSNCLCNCNGGMLEERSTTAKTITSSTTSDEFVDLFDLYNETDLKNGVFDEGL